MPRIHGWYCGNTINVMNVKYLDYMMVIVKIPLMLYNRKCSDFIVWVLW